jgi:hypothetical protein
MELRQARVVEPATGRRRHKPIFALPTTDRRREPARVKVDDLAVVYGF